MKPPIGEVVEEASGWASIDGVEIVAQGEKDGQDCILVKVSRPEVAGKIPSTFKGYPVVVEYTDKIMAQEGGTAGASSVNE